MNRVVITGIGIKSSVGCDIETFWGNIENGKHGISEIDSFDTSDIEVKLACTVRNFNPLDYMDKKEARKTDRYCQLAVAAAKDALTSCGSGLKDNDPYEIGVIIGSGIGGMDTWLANHSVFLEKGQSKVSPFFIPMMISNMAAGTVAMKTGFKGTNYCPVTACASSSNAIGEAFRLIKHGYLTACLTGGAEATINKLAASGFNNMMALSKSTDPNRASIPFDLERNGFVMGEGAGILVLEELNHALARNAEIYAEIVGYGATADAYHMTSPDPEGEGAAKAMELAVMEAGINLSEIHYINAHGTSTNLNDKYETAAVKRVFGEHSKSLAISSTKSMTGHLLGAAGAAEAIICALALREGIIPPTAGYRISDPQCDLDYVTDGARKEKIRYALSNSFGFGGQNASLCFSRFG